jgi:hypothetical protein
MSNHEPTEITKLKNAIRAQYACEPHYLRTVRVDETFDGVTPWHHLVCVFAIAGHPTAQCCYAWLAGYGDEVFAILQSPSVSSPDSAVQAVVAANSAAAA